MFFIMETHKRFPIDILTHQMRFAHSAHGQKTKQRKRRLAHHLFVCHNKWFFYCA